MAFDEKKVRPACIEEELRKQTSLLGNGAHDNLCDFLAKLSEAEFCYVEENW
ncbi:MAG: hypothetical protein P4L62_02565 [Candidatus Pacebacteria bacterium]|nr:hypothetical protein [Candidatus Paceibacterota bacterium]